MLRGKNNELLTLVPSPSRTIDHIGDRNQFFRSARRKFPRNSCNCRQRWRSPCFVQYSLHWSLKQEKVRLEGLNCFVWWHNNVLLFVLYYVKKPRVKLILQFLNKSFNKKWKLMLISPKITLDQLRTKIWAKVDHCGPSNVKFLVWLDFREQIPHSVREQVHLECTLVCRRSNNDNVIKWGTWITQTHTEHGPT